MPFSPDLPDPPVPADTDLTAFGGFVLDVDHLLTSELVAIATPEEFRAAVLLWCHAWKQVPAGSLPNSDKILAKFSGSLSRWPRVRAMALRGFVLCSDGRLYHRFLCAEVMRTRKKQQAYQAERQRVAEWRKRRAEGDDTRTVRVQNGVDHGTVRDPYMLTITGTGTGTRSKKEPNGSSFLHDLPIDPNGSISLTVPRTARMRATDFDQFWQIYPRKVGKAAAARKYATARQTGTAAEELLAAARRYADSMAGTERQYIAHPATWLHQGRWQDEEAPATPMHRVPDEPPPPLEDC